MHKKDLDPTVSDGVAQQQVAQLTVEFIANIQGIKIGSTFSTLAESATDVFFKPFVKAMHEEGSYKLKIPCYRDESQIVNPDTPNVCLKGSPWTSVGQKMMAGPIADEGVSISTFDNFHVVQSSPIKLSELTTTCRGHGTAACTLQGYTVSECNYDAATANDWGNEV